MVLVLTLADAWYSATANTLFCTIATMCHADHTIPNKMAAPSAPYRVCIGSMAYPRPAQLFAQRRDEEDQQQESKLRSGSALTPALSLSRQTRIEAAVTGQMKPRALTGIPGINWRPVTVPSTANGMETAKTRRKTSGGTAVTH
jgi:hypothetical protein